MRIGIDARFLTHPQPGGFKTYTTNLITALSQVDSNNHYLLYLDRTPTDGGYPCQENFSWAVVHGLLPGLGMPIREQLTLRKRLLADKVDLVHFLCNTATIQLPQRYIVTLHDTIQVAEANPWPLTRDLGPYKHWAITAYSKWAILKSIHAANRIVTVSNHEKTKIAQQLQIGLEQITVTHLAPNPLFQLASSVQKQAWRQVLAQRYHLPSKFILGIGYEARKNIPLLIQLFAQVAPEYPELGLVIVAAEANQRALFQTLTHDLGLQNRAIILGACPAQEMAMLYNIAEVFVFPSERESFGLPPLEAMACGVPTLAMNQSSIPEIVQDGALLVDGKDSTHWAAALRQVMVDQQLRAGLIQAGLQRAGQLTWQKCAQATIQIYGEVAEEYQPITPLPRKPALAFSSHSAFQSNPSREKS